jgi:hypothetical protein
MIDLSIIIVNYNVKEFLQNLLNSISKASGNLTIETIVVDNASTDGSVEVIRDNYPEVDLIASESNLGFGAANNLALERAKGKYLLLINPDTIVKEDTFTKLINYLEQVPDIGMIGCKVLNPDGTLQLSCRRSFPGPWTSFTKVTGLSRLFPNSRLFAKYNLTYLDPDESYEVDAISGAFMMFRREVYEKIGGFDPQFFMYGEDLDLCYRTQQAGYKVFYYPETEIIHYKGESTKRSSLDETKVFYDAMHLFVKKHFSASFLVEAILQFAIILRKLVAFTNVYRLVIISIILDFIFYVAAVLISENLYLSPQWEGFPEFVKPWIYILPALIQIVISALSGSYQKNTISVFKSLFSIFLGFIVLSSITFFFKQYAYSRAVIIINYAVLLFLFPLWRIFVKVIFKLGVSSETRKNRTLIVGTGDKAVELASKLKSSFNSIHNVVGLIGATAKDIDTELGSLKVVGSLENITKVIHQNHVDKVIFSSEEISFNQIFKIVSNSQEDNVEFQVAGDNLDYLVGKSSVTMLENIPLLDVYYNISSITSRITKRIFDVILSMIVLILLYPFIYLTDKLKKSPGDFRKLILGAPLVLSGKRSFVGPKREYSYKDLYLGKPGLTGLWFTEAFDSTDQNETGKLDIFYAKNQNIWLDVEILGKTLSKIFIKSE